MFGNINAFNKSMDSLVNELKKEVINAGSWWQGDSYDAYKELFTGKNGGATAIEKIAGSTSSVSDYLIKVAQMLRSWEKTGKELFSR